MKLCLPGSTCLSWNHKKCVLLHVRCMNKKEFLLQIVLCQANWPRHNVPLGNSFVECSVLQAFMNSVHYCGFMSILTEVSDVLLELQVDFLPSRAERTSAEGRTVGRRPVPASSFLAAGFLEPAVNVTSLTREHQYVVHLPAIRSGHGRQRHLSLYGRARVPARRTRTRSRWRQRAELRIPRLVLVWNRRVNRNLHLARGYVALGCGADCAFRRSSLQPRRRCFLRIIQSGTQTRLLLLRIRQRFLLSVFWRFFQKFEKRGRLFSKVCFVRHLQIDVLGMCRRDFPLIIAHIPVFYLDKILERWILPVFYQALIVYAQQSAS